MTAPEIIGDGQAREIAWDCTTHADGPMDRLHRTGEITAKLADTARDCMASPLYRTQFNVPVELWAYVAFHGERGPVEGWPDAR